MATRSRTVVAITAFALLALTGCQPDGPTVVPDPTPTVPPIFESDEEALAAAEEAYGKYLAVVDEISQEGGERPERIESVATGDQAQRELESAKESATLGERGIGMSRFDTMTIQHFDQSPNAGLSIVTVYACLDLSDTDIVGADGSSILPSDAPERIPVEVVFDSSSATSSGLIVANVDIWTGENFCVD